MGNKIVLSKEIFTKMLEANLINLETLEMYFALSEFESQYDSKILVALQPRIDWKELFTD